MPPKKTDNLSDIEILEKCHLFRGLRENELQDILSHAHTYRFSTNAFLFHQDEKAHTFYVLKSGRVRLAQVTPSGHQVIVHHVVQGGGIGVIAALSTATYPISAEAIEESVVLAWDGKSLIELMAKYASFSLKALKIVVSRFQILQDRYRELATERVERRVAHALLRLVDQTSRKVKEGTLIDMPLSRQTLAEMTGTTLYTVSRILSSWEQEDIVSTGRERVVICDIDRVAAIAEDLPQEENRRRRKTSLS